MYDGYTESRAFTLKVTNVALSTKNPMIILSYTLSGISQNDLTPSDLVDQYLILNNKISGRYYSLKFDSTATVKFMSDTGYNPTTGNSYSYTLDTANNQIIIPSMTTSDFETFTNFADASSYTQIAKTIPEQYGTLLGFIVASTMVYPSKGYRNSKFYELLASADSANTLALTDSATTTIKNIAIEEVQQEVITNVD